MAVSDSARLLARGAPVTIAGQPARLVLTFEALEMLEGEFGGLDEFVAALSQEGLKKNRIRNVRKAMTAGLLHSKPPEQDLADFERDVRDKLVFKDFVIYLEALTDALTEAMPEVKLGDDPKENRGNGFPGNASTTSRRRVLAKQRGSSGT